MMVRDGTVTAVDLNYVVLIKSKDNLKNHGFLTNADLKYQEERRKRKVRKLTFEERLMINLDERYHSYLAGQKNFALMMWRKQ